MKRFQIKEQLEATRYKQVTHLAPRILVRLLCFDAFCNQPNNKRGKRSDKGWKQLQQEVGLDNRQKLYDISPLLRGQFFTNILKEK